VTSSYFLKWNWSWKEAGFYTIEDIQAETQKVLDTLTEKNFQDAFQKLRRFWDRCLHAGGNYFEDDGGREALWWVLWFLQRQSGKFWIHPRIVLTANPSLFLTYYLKIEFVFYYSAVHKLCFTVTFCVQNNKTNILYSIL
jgi:hypothetical protein